MQYPIAAITVGAVMAYAVATLSGQLIGRSRFPLPSGSRRVGCVDGLRGYLALSVLIHHFVIWMQLTRLNGRWELPSVPLFSQLGFGGVAMFFMTTGLVFYPRVLAGFSKCSWPAIYIARVFRIIPLIALSVCIITLVVVYRTGFSLDGSFPLTFLKWTVTLSESPILGYPNSGQINAYVLWSLRYEFIFYIVILPVCALLMDRIRNRLPSWTVPLMLFAVALCARLFHWEVGMAEYLPMFATGMLAFELQRREHIARLLRTRIASVAAVAALAVGLLAFHAPDGWAIPFFAFFFACVACGNSMGGLLQSRGALVLGECSYGIYLLHGVVLSVLFIDAAGWTDLVHTNYLPIFMPIAAAMIVFATSRTYLLVERPAIKAGRWLIGMWRDGYVRAGTAKTSLWRSV